MLGVDTRINRPCSQYRRAIQSCEILITLLTITVRTGRVLLILLRRFDRRVLSYRLGRFGVPLLLVLLVFLLCWPFIVVYSQLLTFFLTINMAELFYLVQVDTFKQLFLYLSERISIRLFIFIHFYWVLIVHSFNFIISVFNTWILYLLQYSDTFMTYSFGNTTLEVSIKKNHSPYFSSKKFMYPAFFTAPSLSSLLGL